eukprot:TRINITY_DN32882_c0_g1_i1.p1 TRINITY_DN32882_c0_g1~~TRINITY_DN32882_c0_g1_i1.p1  ORF type:complete len:345 (+),score=36.71 TRINITY_DN32882_c0_g1_i1:102-1136(+)
MAPFTRSYAFLYMCGLAVAEELPMLRFVNFYEGNDSRALKSTQPSVVPDLVHASGNLQKQKRKSFSFLESQDTLEVNTNSTITDSSKQHPMAVPSWYAALRLTITLTAVIKFSCITSNVLLQASPIPVVNQFKAQGTGDLDSAPFVAIAFCSCQSAFYGMFACCITGKSGFLVLLYSNILGLTMGSYYVYAFVTNCTNESVRQKTKLYFAFASVFMAVEMLCIVTMTGYHALFYVGLASCTCSFISGLSLVTAVPEVLRTKCSKALPIQVLVPAEISSLLWFCCGVDLWDPYIALPNFVSFVVCLLALGLAWYYPAEPAKKLQQAGEREITKKSYGAVGSTGGT